MGCFCGDFFQIFISLFPVSPRLLGWDFPAEYSRFIWLDVDPGGNFFWEGEFYLGNSGMKNPEKNKIGLCQQGEVKALGPGGISCFGAGFGVSSGNSGLNPTLLPGFREFLEFLGMGIQRDQGIPARFFGMGRILG